MNDEYKRFIDDLCDIAGFFPTKNLDSQLSEFDPENRRKVETLLAEERRKTVHDIAAHLEALTSLGKAKLSLKGEEICGSPFATMNYDLVCRLEGDDWPGT